MKYSTNDEVFRLLRHQIQNYKVHNKLNNNKGNNLIQINKNKHKLLNK